MPTESQKKWFLEQCNIRFQILTKPETRWAYSDGTEGAWIYPDGSRHQDEPPIDLNPLFKYAPDIIVGICFRYYPGGCECLLTYITEAGFDTEKSWVKNETGDENKSRELSALALFWAIYSAFGGKT